VVHVTSVLLRSEIGPLLSSRGLSSEGGVIGTTAREHTEYIAHLFTRYVYIVRGTVLCEPARPSGFLSRFCSIIAHLGFGS
jgi:hypothetical protein